MVSISQVDLGVVYKFFIFQASRAAAAQAGAVAAAAARASAVAAAAAARAGAVAGGGCRAPARQRACPSSTDLPHG